MIRLGTADLSPALSPSLSDEMDSVVRPNREDLDERRDCIRELGALDPSSLSPSCVLDMESSTSMPFGGVDPRGDGDRNSLISGVGLSVGPTKFV